MGPQVASPGTSFSGHLLGSSMGDTRKTTEGGGVVGGSDD